LLIHHSSIPHLNFFIKTCLECVKESDALVHVPGLSYNVNFLGGKVAILNTILPEFPWSSSSITLRTTILELDYPYRQLPCSPIDKFKNAREYKVGQQSSAQLEHICDQILED